MIGNTSIGYTAAGDDSALEPTFVICWGGGMRDGVFGGWFVALA